MELQEQDLPTQVAGKSKAETMIRGHYSDVLRQFFYQQSGIFIYHELCLVLIL